MIGPGWRTKGTHKRDLSALLLNPSIGLMFSVDRAVQVVFFHLYCMGYGDHNDAHFAGNKTMASGSKWPS